MDARIAQVAKQQRAVAQWHFDLLFDWWRLEVGLVEVVPREEDEDLPGRRLRRRSHWPSEEVRDPRPCRFLPTHRDEYGQGWGVLVRDVIP